MYDPFKTWTRLMAAGFAMSRTAVATAETLSASRRVIDTRMGVIDAALRDPARADHAELARMAPEKLEAFSHAGGVVAANWWAMQAAWLAQAGQVGAVMARGRAPTAGELATLGRRSAEYGVRAVEQAAGVGGAALAPIHAKATANAKRLKRTRPSPRSR